MDPLQTSPLNVFFLLMASLSPTMLIETRMKAVGMASRKISITPMFEKWYILIAEAFVGEFIILFMTLSAPKRIHVIYIDCENLFEEDQPKIE